MEFMEVAGKTIQRPILDRDELAAGAALFKGVVDISSASISGGDQSGVAGEGSLSSVSVTSVDLSHARLTPVELSTVRFDGVDLSNAKLSETIARRVEFLGCRGIGLQILLVQAADVYFEDCRLDFGSIGFGRVKNAVIFRRCSFREAVISGDLSNVVFDDSDLASAEFEARRADGCDVTTSRLAGARGLLTLRGARITGGQAGSIAAQIAREAGLVVVG